MKRLGKVSTKHIHCAVAIADSMRKKYAHQKPIVYYSLLIALHNASIHSTITYTETPLSSIHLVSDKF